MNRPAGEGDVRRIKKDREILPSPDTGSEERAPEQQFEALNRIQDDTQEDNIDFLELLKRNYIELLKSIGNRKHKDALKVQIISKIAHLREQIMALEESQFVVIEEDAELIEPNMFTRFKGDDFFSTEERQKFFEIFESLTQDLKIKYIARIKEMYKKPTQASKCTAFSSILFELSRIAIVKEQDLELITDANAPRIAVNYLGYARNETDFSPERRTSHKKGAPIDFDVPIIRDGLPYSYETKSYPRRQFGADFGVRNQALKYQAAIEEGQISGATIEIRGRIDPEFIQWAMGTAIHDLGAIPSVEIIYTTELPSGKEYRFVLKRSEAGEGLKFHNEEHYDEDERELIGGLQHAIVDKSIHHILSDIDIDPDAAQVAYEQFFDFNIVDLDTFKKAVSELMGIDFTKPEQLKGATCEFVGNIDNRNTLLNIWDKVFGNMPDNINELPLNRLRHKLRKRIKQADFNEEKTFQVLSNTLSIADFTANPEESIKALWDYSLATPGCISSRRLYDIYCDLRTKNVFSKLRAYNEQAKINTDNRVSVISEHANSTYIERLIEGQQRYYQENPHIAKMKKQYIITEDAIPLATVRTMMAAQEIAKYENARADSPEEIGKKAERVAMGWTGRPEGVALDIEHVAIDSIYAMNVENFKQKEAVKAVGKDGVPLFFKEVEGGKFKLKYRSQAELDEAMVKEPALAKKYQDLTKGQLRQLRNLYKLAEFERDYNWTERFFQVEEIPALIEGQDRKYQEIHVYDAQTGRTERHAKTNDEKIENKRYDITRENVDRARNYIAGTKRVDQHKRTIANVEARIESLAQEKDEATSAAEATAAAKVKEINTRKNSERKRMKDLRKQKRSADATTQVKIDHEILQIEKALKDNKLTEAVFQEVREVSKRYRTLIKQQYEALESLYREVIPRKEWETFAQEVIFEKEENIIKYIFAVTADGEIFVQEEVVRADVTGRAAHSELGMGRNVYGAGEFVFNKIDGAWVLKEINNGSGHYKPEATSTLPYVRNLIAQKGVDISQVELVDSVSRGKFLKDMGAF